MSIVVILYIRQQETVLSLKIEGKADRTAKGYKFICRPQIYSSIINKTGPLFLKFIDNDITGPYT